MNDEDKKMAIATFRFGVIADLVNQRHFPRGEKRRILTQKSSTCYSIPFSSRTQLSKQCILKWVQDYKKGGQRIETLFPKTRADKGTFRSMDPTVKLAILDTLKANPEARTKAIMRDLLHKRIINADTPVNRATIYKFIKKERCNPARTSTEDRRRFEAEYSNQSWQSDVMHGPRIRMDGRSRKTYLIAFIDDYSRFIIHAEFFLSEGVGDYKIALKNALAKRGIPQKLYVDNGSCFRSGNLEQIGASLGFSISHSRPYTPQGRGKIERWFRTLRENFLVRTDYGSIHLDELNESLDVWVDEYNRTVHSTTGELPRERYMRGIECHRPVPNSLLDYFRITEQRRVKKDRTFQLNTIVFEAPAQLIDRKIDVKHHPEEPNPLVEIFYEGRSHGYATRVNSVVNGRVGRDWMKEIVREEKAFDETPTIKSGTLTFGKEESCEF